MRTTLRKIGNSRGIIIPAAVLAQTDIVEEVEIRLDGRRIVIEAGEASRKNWYTAYDASQDDDAWKDLSPAADSGEWEW